jgi:hypothetical protein
MLKKILLLNIKLNESMKNNQDFSENQQICYLSKIEKYLCKKCDYITSDKSNMNRHINTKKHKLCNIKYNENYVNHEKKYKDGYIVNSYSCDICDYKTPHLCNLKKHLTTNRHIKKQLVVFNTKYNNTTCKPNMVANIDEKYINNQTKTQTIMEKNKEINTIIQQDNEVNKGNVGDDAEYIQLKNKADRVDKLERIIETLLEQNSKLTESIKQTLETQNTAICDIAKQPRIVQNNNTSFNIMNYLNNDCKDALNLSDFLNNVQICYDDLLMIKDNGYIYGMEKNLINELTNMEETKRPIQCTDIKRKKFFVKEDEVWNADDGNERLNEALNKITNKHIKELQKWKERNPDWMENDRKFDMITDITCQILKGSTNTGEQLKKKIVDKLSKAVKVNK